MRQWLSPRRGASQTDRIGPQPLRRSTGIARPRFWERAEYYGETERLAQALAAAEVRDGHGDTMGDASA